MITIKTTPNSNCIPRWLTKLLPAVLVALAFLAVPMTVAPVSAQSVQDYLCSRVPGPECRVAGDDTPLELARTVTDVLTFLIATISVVVIVIAGFMFVASAGNPDTVKRAKNAIIYAFIGIAVAFVAQVLVRFILSRL